MAALKKPLKKKDSGKPSTALIIFLVFFILLSIGLGVFSYYGYEGQEKLREAAKSAKAGENAAKSAREYRLGLVHMLGNALGQDVDADDLGFGTDALAEIRKEGGKYNDATLYKDRQNFIKLFGDLNTDLTYDEAQKKFRDNYRAKFKQLQADLKKTETQLATTQKALQDAQSQFTAYQTKVKAFYDSALDQIGKGNAAAKDAADKKFESFAVLLKQNQEILDQKIEVENKLKAAEDRLGIEKALVNKILEEKKNTSLEVVQSKKNTDQHALVLDLSRGVPLWDRPVGKVSRVDLDRRQVYVNVGSDLGVRPGLTFNIFADDGKGQADKFLKGTIEIIRVVDGQTSLGRLTSLYDAAGREIALNDPTRGRAAREVETVIREGDLLFNLFWNSHVAIAGIINFTGLPIEAPSEQMRQVESFAQQLERMGVHVDGYLDLTDGQLKGGFSPKTRFLILGDSARVRNPNDAAQVDRAKLINDGIAALKKDAIEKGMFLISAENFTIASGYRKARNANDNSLTSFRASVPLAGASTPGLVIERDRPAAAPMPMEKKEPEAKEKEAK